MAGKTLAATGGTSLGAAINGVPSLRDPEQQANDNSRGEQCDSSSRRAAAAALGEKHRRGSAE